ncbi:MAG: alanine--tRNA ligase [Solirubrobacteraceae bacterium]
MVSLTSDDIRERFLDFFVQRDHLRVPSAPLVPATYDPSVLLTTAGMHPLKPYFLGAQTPPHNRLASCQKCFRTTDIENVGNTTRHLTFFEMLGNFSLGDYFKQGAVEFAWELSLEGFGIPGEDIWITVFEGDEELGLGPDEEAIAAWESVGVPRERIVLCPRSENFWQAGPTGPCGPCSELYVDRGTRFGSPDDLPGGDNERFVEYWNLVFMQFNQEPPGTLTPLPARNIDTGLGLNRLAAILQDVPSIFETDQFRPLVELGEELSGRRYGEDVQTTRALRILADHSRAITFLVADGVVPSNEDRGYILRRVMRRAIQQGRRLGLQPGFLPRFAERVIELMGGEYRELVAERDAIRRWLEGEEESFGRTLEHGTRLLDEVVARTRESGGDRIDALDAFLLHDTYGFPFDLTRELVAEQGLEVDEPGFDTLMDEQRRRARAGAARPGGDDVREQVQSFAGGAGFETDFTGYETVEQHTTVGAVDHRDGRALVKLVESPFYAAGGGQVSDAGAVECETGGCHARVTEVYRLGDDQAVELDVEKGELAAGERVVARVDPRARRATEANHTATHLLHAALRARLGTHVRQAGSYVGPDKLRFDFTHGQALTAQERQDVEDQVNAWIEADTPVRALTTTLDEARRLGAMALFGEKYGDVVRMVEVGDGSFSRELCGGTHVRLTGEVGLFKILSESSSAANVRRIEAITGPAAVEYMRRRDAELAQVEAALRAPPGRALHRVEQLKREGGGRADARDGVGTPAVDVDQLAGRASQADGAVVLTEAVAAEGEKDLLAVMDRLKSKLGDAAIVLAAVGDGRVLFVASVAPALVERGVKAGEVVKAAARVAGGGGGGRDTMARAGGRDPGKLDEALRAARQAIEASLR